MDKSILTDTLDTIKERLSSPVFGTFIFSFLITNWKIPVGAFLPIQQVKELGYKSYFELFENNTHFGWPIGFTLFYIFIFPWLKNFIIALNNLSEKVTDNWWLNKAKNASIPFNKYFELRSAHEIQEKKLKEIIDNEGEYLKKYDNLWSDYQNLKSQNKSIEDENEKVKRVNKSNFFNGSWMIKNFLHQPDDKERSYFIRNREIMSTDNEGSKNIVAEINSHSYSTHDNKILLIVSIRGKGAFFVYEISLNDEYVMSGTVLSNYIIQGSTKEFHMRRL